MKITYLGTAAAEGMPAVFCNCDACKRAKINGGIDIRSRSQVLINNDLLLDFPMDTYFHAIKNNLDLSAVHTVLITHSHMDHCYVQDFMNHGAPYAHNMTQPVINLFGNQTVINTFNEHNQREIKKKTQHITDSVKLNVTSPYTTFNSCGYTIYALPAVHTVGENCLVYLIEKAGSSVLMLNDTGILPDEVYKHIASIGIMPDLISFDCTYGYLRKGAGRHMGMLDAADETARMKKFGIIKDSAKLVVTHFSHNGGMLHSQLKQKADALGFTTAHDGMIIEI